MAVDMTDWDFENLSDDQITYIRNTGNPELMRRAGLMEPVTFDLTGTPGSLQPHELQNEPMPVFDPDSKIAEESVGDPNSSADVTLQPTPGPAPVVETTPFEGSTVEADGKADTQKPAAKKAAASKTSTS
jgi:hypothetical protein